MTPKQAMIELLAGKKLYKIHWIGMKYIYIREDGKIVNDLDEEFWLPLTGGFKVYED